jgi:hypothetical protein
MEIQCSAPLIGDNDSFSVQLEAVRVNGIRTMQTVKSLVTIVPKLSSEVQQLRIDNETWKTQLRDLQQASSHVPSIRREVASSAATKSCRDVACAVGGNTGATAVTAPDRNFLP